MGGSPTSESPTGLPAWTSGSSKRVFQPWPFPLSAPPGSKAVVPPAPVFPCSASTQTCSESPVSQVAALPGSQVSAPSASALSASAPSVPALPGSQVLAPSVSALSASASSESESRNLVFPEFPFPASDPADSALSVSVPSDSALSASAPSGSALPASNPSAPALPASQVSAPEASAWSSESRNPLLPVTVTAPPVSQVSKGVAQISIPQEVFASSDPLWRSFAVGYFIGDAPHVGTIHATINRLWTKPGGKSKIDVQFIAENTVLFRIVNDQIRSKVVRRRYWHISNVPLVVHEWNPETAKNPPDLSAMPLWVDLKHVPCNLFSETGLSCLGAATGNFVKLHPNTERCTRLDVARMLVEVNLHKPLIEHINFKDSGGEDVTVDVAYPWLPPRCTRCQQWGHLPPECKTKVKATGEVANTQVVALPEKPAANVPPQIVVSDLLKELSLVTPVADTQQRDTAVSADDVPHKLVSADAVSNLSENEWKIMGKKGSVSPGKAIDAEIPNDLRIGNAHSTTRYDILGQLGENEELEEGELTLEKDSGGKERTLGAAFLPPHGPVDAQEDSIESSVPHKAKPPLPKSHVKPARKPVVGYKTLKFLQVHAHTKKASIRKQ